MLQKRKKIVIIIVAIIVLLAVLGGNTAELETELSASSVKDLVIMEAGGPLPMISGFVITNEEAAFVTDMDKLDGTKIGDYEIRMKVGDEICSSVLRVEDVTEDTEAPVIQGAADMQIFLGESVSYRKNISVTDNSQIEPVLTVDTSKVNLEAPGAYPVVYTAQDNAGNITSVTVQLTIELKVYTQEEVDVLADGILAQIITEDMSQRDKAVAIYNWITSHVSYISHSYGDDWIRSAYEGLALRKGDCRVYAATAKELLTRAGIINMDIRKIPSSTDHFWNLVDVGEGWLHFDTCPRSEGIKGFCLWTDAELMEFSQAHNGTHNYDHDAYPQVN